MAKMSIANITSNPICISGARALRIDFSTTWRPKKRLDLPLLKSYSSRLELFLRLWNWTIHAENENFEKLFPRRFKKATYNKKWGLRMDVRAHILQRFQKNTHLALLGDEKTRIFLYSIMQKS